jgi:hypothetical protein
MADDVSSAQGTVKPEFNCDGTHMNRNILSLLQREIDAVFKP